MRGTDPIHPKYLIISAELLSDLGNQFVQLTLLDLLIFKGESALSNLLLMCVLQQAPSIFLSPFAGLWIDRVGGRKWLIIVNLSKCLLVGVIVFKSYLWVIFPAYLCFIIGSLFFHIGRLSLTPMLIPKDEIVSFNSLNERVSLAGSIFGPWLIGWIVLKTSEGVAFALAGLLLALSACSVYGLPKLGRVNTPTLPSPPGPDPGPDRVFKGNSLFRGGRARAGFKGEGLGGGEKRQSNGLRHLLLKYKEPLRGNHNLKGYFLIFGFVLLGGGVLNIGLPIFFKTNFGKDIADWGLILSGFQAGSCLATFLLPRWSSTFRHQTILTLTFLTLGGGMAILGQLTTHIQIAILMILFGCGFTLIHIFLESLIQQNSPKAHMGKTISLLTTYKGACYLGTILISALVLKIWGPQSLLLICSFIMVSASFLANRNLGSSGVLE